MPIPASRSRHRSPQPIPSQSPSSPVNIPGRYSYSSSPVSTCGTGSPARSPTMATLIEQSEDGAASRQIFNKILNASGSGKKGTISPDEENVSKFFQTVFIKCKCNNFVVLVKFSVPCQDYVVVSSDPPSDNSYDSSKSSGSSRSNRKRSSDVFG